MLSLESNKTLEKLYASNFSIQNKKGKCDIKDEGGYKIACAIRKNTSLKFLDISILLQK